MRAGKNEERQDPAPPAEAAAAVPPPGLTIDWDRYLQYLEESDAPEADKRALVECLWSIMVSFVDLGFRLSPVQEICGEPLPPRIDEPAAVVASDEPSTRRTFTRAAGAEPEEGRQA